MIKRLDQLKMLAKAFVLEAACPPLALAFFSAIFSS